MIRLLLVPALLISLTSCSLIPVKKSETKSTDATEKIATSQNATVEKVIEGEKRPVVPPPNIRIGGWGNKVDLKPEPQKPSSRAMEPLTIEDIVAFMDQRSGYRERTHIKTEASQKAGSSEHEMSKYAVSLPWGVAMLFAAAGILAVMFAIKSARKSSAAVDAFATVADKGIAQGIRTAHEAFGSAARRLQDQAMASTDPKEQATLARTISNLEADRGKVSSSLEAERGKMASQK